MLMIVTFYLGLDQNKSMQAEFEALVRILKSLSTAPVVANRGSTTWTPPLVLDGESGMVRECNKLANGMIKLVWWGEFLCHRFLAPPDDILDVFHDEYG
ncbi:hypothetical protein V6N13_125228 [Hibiscus sabdariffa]